MKRILLLIFTVFAQGAMAQSAGFGNTFVILSIGGSQDLYYDLNANTSNYDFEGQTLGTFCQGNQQLVLKGGENNIWKCGGCDLYDTGLNYRIYPTGIPSGSFTYLGFNYTSGNNNGCGGQDQKWSKTNANINLMQGLTPGNYTLEVYCQGATTCNGGSIYASNNGQNYKASFTVNGNTWIGTTDTDWAKPSNWSCGSIPNADTDATIPNQANAPVITGNAAVKSATVTTGAVVSIATGATLTVHNALVNNGQVVVDNNGALVQTTGSAYSGSGTATVIRNSNALYRLDYTLWGSPVAAQNLLDFSPETSANPSRFYSYAYAAADNLEVYRSVTPSATNFEPGRGYLIRMPNVSDTLGYNQGNTPIIHKGIFTGALNNGDINVSVLIGPDNQSNHYVAVSNPYASPLNVAAFFAQNSAVLQAGNGIYFWRKRNNANNSSYGHLTMAGFAANSATGGSVGNGGSYYSGNTNESGSFNSNWIISPGQGFFVKLKDGLSNTASIKFTNSMRQAAPQTGGQPFFRTLNNDDETTPITTSRLWINLTGANNSFSQALVGYMPQGTEGLDYGYDALILSDGTTKVYSKAGENRLAIQAKPQFNDADVVPMGFTVPVAGQYTLSLNQMDGVFTQEQDVLVKDNLLGTVSSIKTADYTFSSDAGTFDTRFEIVYQPQGQLGVNTPGPENQVVVYNANGAIHITAGNIEIKGITVHDISGRKLYAQTGISTTEAWVNGLAVAQQVLIVTVATANGTVTKKIVY